MELYNKENASNTVKNVFDIEFERGVKKGIEIGIEQGKSEMIKNLLLNNIPIEIIKNATKFSLEEIKRIERTLNEGNL